MTVVLITGCSSGIGKASAQHLARRGYRVYATVRGGTAARHLSQWAAEQQADLHPIPMDVTDAGAVERGVAEVLADAGRLDVLVNNAGIAIPGALEEMEATDLERVMQVNFYGPLRVTRSVLPHMRRQAAGRIIMLSSLSALVGLPGMGAYSASKAALELASESLRLEVDRFGIQVSVVEPGAFATAMPGKILDELTVRDGSPYAPLFRHLRVQAAESTGGGDDPLRIAELLEEVIATPRPAFRYPAGKQAEHVVRALAGLDAAGRDAFIRAVDGTEWWSEGRGEPG